MNRFGAVFAAVALVIAVPVGCSVISMINTAATAPARVVNKTLETNNIIMNYELFHDEEQNFRARVMQVNQSKKFLDAELDAGEKARLRMELAAQQQSCRELVADYNSNSEKLNRKVFKDRGLPFQLDATKCEV